MIKVPLEKPQPDIDNFVKVILGETKPDRPPLVELFLDREVEQEICCNHLGREWVEPEEGRESQAAFLKNWLEVYYRMGL